MFALLLQLKVDTEKMPIRGWKKRNFKSSGDVQLRQLGSLACAADVGDEKSTLGIRLLVLKMWIHGWMRDQ